MSDSVSGATVDQTSYRGRSREDLTAVSLEQLADHQPVQPAIVDTVQ